MTFLHRFISGSSSWLAYFQFYIIHIFTKRISVAQDLCDFHDRDLHDRTALAIASAKKLEPVVQRLLEAYESDVIEAGEIQASEQIHKVCSHLNVLRMYA